MRKLGSVRSKISKSKTVVERTSEPHCSSELFTMKFHLLNHVAENLEILGILSFTSVAPFDHANVHRTILQENVSALLSKNV